MRIAIKTVLVHSDDFHVIGEGSTIAKGMSLLLEHKPDLLLLDLYLPDGNGVNLVAFRNEHSRDTKILVITSSNNETEILAVLKAGAEGIIGKDSPPDLLRFAISEVLDGKNYLTNCCTMALLNSFKRNEQTSENLQRSLSQRKLQVLKLLAKGATNRQIANELVISESTVRSHLQLISQELGLKNKRELIVYAMKHLPEKITDQ
jgi:two-component system response regulator NreC